MNLNATVNRSNINAWRAAYLIAASLLFFVDQITKAWAQRRLRFGDEVVVAPGFLKFIYAENTGIAFGQLQDGGFTGRWVLAGLAIAATVGVLFYFFRNSANGRTDDRVLGACALLLAGIVGNLFDRVRLGYVIDFILLHAGTHYWPVFNVADASICAGAALLALDAFLSRGQRSEVRSQ